MPRNGVFFLFRWLFLLEVRVIVSKLSSRSFSGWGTNLRIIGFFFFRSLHGRAKWLRSISHGATKNSFFGGALTEGKGDKNKQLESRGQEAFVFFFVFESDKSTPKVYILSTNLDGFRLGEKNMEKWTLSHILGCENIYTIVYIFIYVFIYVWDLFHLS